VSKTCDLHQVATGTWPADPPTTACCARSGCSFAQTAQYVRLEADASVRWTSAIVGEIAVGSSGTTAIDRGWRRGRSRWATAARADPVVRRRGCEPVKRDWRRGGRVMPVVRRRRVHDWRHGCGRVVRAAESVEVPRRRAWWCQ